MNDISKLFVLFGFIFLLIILSSTILGFMYNIDEGNVAIIKIHSSIGIDDSFLSGDVGSDSIINMLKSAEDNPNVEAIILSINSPGGTVIASKEVAEYILGMNKTVAAWIRDTGASGAYLIASACDYIVADPLSSVGSIGATMAYVSINGTLEKYGAVYNSLSSGALKDMGSSFKDLGDDERIIFFDIINDSFNYFIGFVSEKRNLSEYSIGIVSDGRIVSGKKAFELGLIDGLGSREQIYEYFGSINISEINPYYINEESSFDFSSVLGFNSDSAYPVFE
jgi:protease-4